MPKSEPRMEHCFDHIELMIAEILEMVRRLEEIDPNALLRMEQIMSKMRIRKSVEKHCH